MLFNYYKHKNSSASTTTVTTTTTTTTSSSTTAALPSSTFSMFHNKSAGHADVASHDPYSNANAESVMDTQAALTAAYWFPDGGAMRMLDEMLVRRNSQGAAYRLQHCQKEKSAKGHKYVGRYPCEKNRL
jgi:hypothetical protein